MGEMIFNLGNKKCENNNNSTGHINRIQKSLLISIVDTPEKDVSNVDSKLDKIKVFTSSINALTLFSCSMRAIYNMVHCAQNKRLLLKSYIPVINTSIFPKKHYGNIFSETLSMNYMPGLKITLI